MTAPHRSQSASPKRRRAILVGVALPARGPHETEDHLEELAALAESAGVAVVDRLVQARKAPDPRTFIGKGKVEELAGRLKELTCDLVLFDDDLTGSQVQKLEDALDAQVMDRSGLILEIFEQRARSREARTQVELARSRYLLPRLTRRWQHLSRQVGGIGVRGGEGETQLEADRRVLRRQIARLERDLVTIEKMRATQRRGREGTPIVALAGYTNAGKSTLFNRLTRDTTLAEDRLFATLDSRLRRGALGDGGPVVVFVDTVGFIRKLPHHLVASFRSTLEEVVEADLVLHVVDRAHPAWEEQRRVAEEVLTSLGVERERILLVLNKRDLWSGPAEVPLGAVAVSATAGTGLDALLTTIHERLVASGTLAALAEPEA